VGIQANLVPEDPLPVPVAPPIPPAVAPIPALPARLKTDIWRLKLAKKCKCEGQSVRCGYRKTCVLRPTYEAYAELIHLKHKDTKAKTRVKDMDLKFFVHCCRVPAPV
jgi:hypothetical protein